MAELPFELVAEIIGISAWDSAQLQKPWLCSIATTSRVVWAIVKPALYDTVLLSSFRAHRIIACAGSGHFEHTRRLWCGSPYAFGQPAEIARIFAGVRHFDGWDVLFFKLCDEPGAKFRPVKATLMLEGVVACWNPLRTLRHITHLHLAFASYRTVIDHIGTLDGTRALKYVLVSSLQHDAQPDELIDRILPFFFACRSLERLLVRVSPNSELQSETVRALQDYVLLTGEERLWTCVERRDADALYPGAVTIAEDKWLHGERVEVDVHKPT